MGRKPELHRIVRQKRLKSDRGTPSTRGVESSGDGAKYFVIGFDRTGTTAINHFFERNGIPAISYDRGKLAQRIDANLRDGRFVLQGYEQYRVFSDMVYLRPHIHIEAYKYYPQIMEQVPSAKFILSTRNREHWIDSRIRASGGEFHWVRMYQAFYGLKNMQEVVSHWRREWDNHHAAVQEGIPSDRLLIFNIEDDSPLLLCRFSGLKDSAAKYYQRKNASLNGFGKFIGNLFSLSVKRRIPNPIKERVKRLFWVSRTRNK